MQEGILTAADAVKRETGVDKINVVGYCVGGTLLATTLAYLAARGEEPFNSASVPRHAGRLHGRRRPACCSPTTDQLEALNELMSERGYLDGSRMANVFNMLRPRDLIWPYIVNNYLLGKKPFPFDLLYWNQDSTRMAAANHNFYLREFYNRQPPRRRHLEHRRHAPRRAQGQAAGLRAGDEGRSHRAGALGLRRRAIVRRRRRVRALGVRPHRRRRQSARQDEVPVLDQRQAQAKSLEQWLATAKEHPGSWWPHWAEWLAEHSGEWTVPREPGEKLGVIEDAPGAYVKMKS